MRPSRVAALGCALLAWPSLAHAQVGPEVWTAHPDSPFIQHALSRPFAADLGNIPLVTELLRASGNESRAELLERAEMRTRLAALLGETAGIPETVRAAIEAERAAAPLDEAAVRALDRVVIGYAGDRGAVQVESSPQGPTRVSIAMSVRNGLAARLERVGFSAGQRTRGQAEGVHFGLSCEFEPHLAPGETRTVSCRGDDHRDRVDAGIRVLEQRAVPAPLPARFIASPLVNVSGTHVYRETSGDVRSAARMQLAGARCEDKGTCAIVERKAGERQSAEAKARLPMMVTIAGVIAALLLAAFAASRTQRRATGGWFVSLLAVLVLAYAALAAAGAIHVMRPRAGMEGMVFIAFVYYSAIPFMVVLAALDIACLAGARTRLRVFAATFGTALALLFAGFAAYA